MKVALVVCAVLSFALVIGGLFRFIISILCKNCTNSNYLQFAGATYVDDEDIENFDIETYATIADKLKCIKVRLFLWMRAIVTMIFNKTKFHLFFSSPLISLGRNRKNR